MGYPDMFQGYAVKSKEKWSDFHRMEYIPKRFEDFDNDVEITHCGVLCERPAHYQGWVG
jgi:alcohol dehydrogenase (NADP+)